MGPNPLADVLTSPPAELGGSVSAGCTVKMLPLPQHGELHAAILDQGSQPAEVGMVELDIHVG